MGDLFYRRVPGPQDTYFTSSVAYKYHQDGFLAQGLGKEQQLQVRTGADYDDRQAEISGAVSGLSRKWALNMGGHLVHSGTIACLFVRVGMRG